MLETIEFTKTKITTATITTKVQQKMRSIYFSIEDTSLSQVDTLPSASIEAIIYITHDFISDSYFIVATNLFDFGKKPKASKFVTI